MEPLPPRQAYHPAPDLADRSVRQSLGDARPGKTAVAEFGLLPARSRPHPLLEEAVVDPQRAQGAPVNVAPRHLRRAPGEAPPRVEVVVLPAQWGLAAQHARRDLQRLGVVEGQARMAVLLTFLFGSRRCFAAAGRCAESSA